MRLPNDNRSGQSETATSLHHFYIYRLKGLQQIKRHIIFQIVVAFSQLPLTRTQIKKVNTSHNNFLIKKKLFFLWRCDPTQQTNFHAPGGIRTHDLSRRAAADLRLRLRGHWDRQKRNMANIYKNVYLATCPEFVRWMDIN